LRELQEFKREFKKSSREKNSFRECNKRKECTRVQESASVRRAAVQKSSREVEGKSESESIP
jgi:hypothetical protein